MELLQEASPTERLTHTYGVVQCYINYHTRQVDHAAGLVLVESIGKPKYAGFASSDLRLHYQCTEYTYVVHSDLGVPR